MSEQVVAPAQFPTPPTEIPVPTEMLQQIAKSVDLLNALVREIAISLRLPEPPALPLLPPITPGLFLTQIQRVSVYRFPYGGMPGKDLVPRYIGSYSGRLGEYAELYAFCFGTDIDALVSIMPTNDKFLFEITRLTVAQLNVYIDGVHKGGFPELTDVEARAGGLGYIALIA